VLSELFDAPVALPSDLVYFARTASLIEGLGTRYDPHFNAIEFASPIALKLRGRIMASLRGDSVSPSPDEWVVALGGFLGEVAGVVQRAGKEIVSIVGARLFTGGVGIESVKRLGSPTNGVGLAPMTTHKLIHADQTDQRGSV
jgi:hypothetical protein